MTAADHADTVREAFDAINETEYPAYQDVIRPALAALDALVALAETADEEPPPEQRGSGTYFIPPQPDSEV